MEVLMKVILPIPVLMLTGIGFIDLHAMTDSFSYFCFHCIE